MLCVCVVRHTCSCQVNFDGKCCNCTTAVTKCLKNGIAVANTSKTMTLTLLHVYRYSTLRSYNISMINFVCTVQFYSYDVPMVRSICTAFLWCNEIKMVRTHLYFSVTILVLRNGNISLAATVTADQEHGPCMLCCKHNELSKRMVWLTIPCKLLSKISFMSISNQDGTQTQLKLKLWLYM